jgi:hypothetical protein
VRRFLGLVAAVAVLAVPAAFASPPEAGVLVPGESLGGVRLGWTLAQVERVWGTVSGRCRDCPVETRYFNRVPFRPEGAAVELRRGRVVAVLTLWAPRRWHTDRNVYVGEPERRVQRTHGDVQRRRCPGFDALLLRQRGRTRSVVFVVDGTVWGFGLLAPGERVCR